MCTVGSPLMARRNTYGDGGLFKRADGQWVGTVEVPSADGKRRAPRPKALVETHSYLSDNATAATRQGLNFLP